MARMVPLWLSPDVGIHLFDHPAEHEDQPYEAITEGYVASFIEKGDFDLEVGESRWRVGTGDVMIRPPGVRIRAGFQGDRFNDTCLRLSYLAAEEDGFDADRSWSRRGRFVLRESNRSRYLHWSLRRALRHSDAMLIEYCATEIFRADPQTKPTMLYSDRKFPWYAERVHHVRERLDAEYAEDHSAADLARSVGMSTFHFIRVFAELIGSPPHRHLLQVRLRRAHEMLREGRTVTETCFACGFNNLSHFSRTFARHFGRNPSMVAR